MEDLLRLLFPVILMLGLFYFMLFLPEKKRKNAYNKMISELKVNDEIITRGGVVGKIVKLDDDSIILESGPDRARIKFTKSAIMSVTAANSMAE